MPAKMDTLPEEKSVIFIAAHEDKSGIGQIRMSQVDNPKKISYEPSL